MGFLLNVVAAGAIFGAGYYVGGKRCENRHEVAQRQSSRETVYGSDGQKTETTDPTRQCDGPAVAHYLWEKTWHGAVKVKRGIDDLVQ